MLFQCASGLHFLRFRGHFTFILGASGPPFRHPGCIFSAWFFSILFDEFWVAGWDTRRHVTLQGKWVTPLRLVTFHRKAEVSLQRGCISRIAGVPAPLKELTLVSPFLNLSDSLTDSTGIPEGFPAGGWRSSRNSGTAVKGFRIGIPAQREKNTRSACQRHGGGYIYILSLIHI